MTLFVLAALMLTPVILNAAGEHQAFRLEPGDYRWVPFTIKQTPTEVDCKFEVLQGGLELRVELLPMSEFRLFSRGREHSTLVVMQQHSGAFRRIIDQPGQYAVVLKDIASQAETVSLELNTDVNPNAGAIARELPARRRLTVILVSFGLFFVIVSVSGLWLVRSIKP
jgi:hypothetical protein